MLIPVQFNDNPTGNGTIVAGEVEILTLKCLKITEAVLEEFVRKNTEILFPEGETLLVVSQQPKNKAGGRADLVAVDGEGNIVLIELKRDAEDIVARREPFEFQAIRYAANYALITTPQDLVQKLFAPYIEKHQEEYDLQGLTASELAFRILTDFLQTNKAENSFNLRQRIVLIASSFDPQTLSACAWLAKNKIDIRCLRLSPVRYDTQYFFEVEQVIPPPSLDQYFVEITDPTNKPGQQTSVFPKTNLPKMPELFQWSLVSAGDMVYIKGHELEAAEVRDQSNVLFGGQAISFNTWGQKVTGWSAINIYEWTIHKPSGKTLDALRRAKMEEIEQEISTGGTSAP